MKTIHPSKRAKQQPPSKQTQKQTNKQTNKQNKQTNKQTNNTKKKKLLITYGSCLSLAQLVQLAPMWSIARLREPTIHVQPWCCRSSENQKNMPAYMDLQHRVEEITKQFNYIMELQTIATSQFSMSKDHQANLSFRQGANGAPWYGGPGQQLVEVPRASELETCWEGLPVTLCMVVCYGSMSDMIHLHVNPNNIK